MLIAQRAGWLSFVNPSLITQYFSYRESQQSVDQSRARRALIIGLFLLITITLSLSWLFILLSHGPVGRIWPVRLALESMVVIILFARRIWRGFPLFATYVVINLLRSVVLYGLHGYAAGYQYIYWPLEMLTVVWRLSVVYEVFRIIFSGHRELRQAAAAAFQIAVVIPMIVGCVAMYTHSSFMIVDESILIIEVGLIMALFLLSGAFGLHWRQAEFGIALGLGIFTAVELLAITLQDRFGIVPTLTLRIARELSFDTGLLVWLGYLLIPEKLQLKRRGVNTIATLSKSRLEQWNQKIARLLT